MKAVKKVENEKEALLFHIPVLLLDFPLCAAISYVEMYLKENLNL